jgi:ATP-binding cassette, subfamily B, multidrug efflux pump
VTDAADEAEDARQVAAEARASQSAGPGRMAAAGMPADKPKDLAGATRRLIDRLRPDRRAGLLVIVLGAGSVTLAVIGPTILGHATDIIVEGVQSPSGIDTEALHRVLLGAMGLYIGSSVLAYIQAYLLAAVVQRTMQTFRADVEAKLNRLPLSYVDNQPRGDLLSRVTNDLDNVAQSMQQSLSQMLTAVLTLVGVLVMMLVISPLLAMVAVLSIPAALLTVRTITRRSKGRFITQWARTGSLNGQVEEAFTGHALVKVLGRQEDVEARFDETNEELYEAGYSAQFIAGTIQPAMMFLSNLSFVVVAVVGGLQVASGALSLGDVQAFIQYSRQFSQPLTQVASMMNVLQSGIASAERVFELLDTDEEIADSGIDAIWPPGPRGRVAFEHVTFSYNPDKPLITDLSLVAEPGQTVAIVGPTGAGKTTLVNLLMRFYELDGGRITLDGTDIASISRRSLRSDMAMVLQDTWLFGGTIRDNIAYGNLDATDAEILAAAQATYVDRFVHSLPEGYDTVIDDDAGNLSTGEKQLLTIARAFLAEPTILILDEATSSVDTRTEVLVQHAMAALRSERTSFVIAHRLSTIRDADTILVMDGGQIVEQGSHEELLAQQGAYFELYHAQFAAPLVEDPEIPEGAEGPLDAQVVAAAASDDFDSLNAS